jgi:hypothetical protein
VSMLRTVTAIAPTSAKCNGCGYSLATLPAGKCPECGQEFDPADAATHIGSIDGLIRWCRRAPGWRTNLVVGAAIVVMLYCASSPNSNCSDVLSFFWHLVLQATLMVWFAAFAVHLVPRCLLRRRGVKQPPPRLTWVVVPVVLLASHLAQQSCIVFRARWECAKEAFEDAQKLGPALRTPCWIGPFYVTRVDARPTGETVYHLGWTDPYSQGGAEIVHVTERDTWVVEKLGPVLCGLEDNWFITFNPT